MTLLVNSGRTVRSLSAHQGHAVSAPFSARLWQPDEESDDCQYLPRPARRQEDLSVMGQLTVREAFMTHMLPQLTTDKKAKATIDCYLNAIGHWERIMSSLGTADRSIPKNPQMYQIDDELCESFRAFASEGNPATTCNKWFRHLRAILNMMGPRLAHNKRSRRNKCYFIEVPWLEDLEEDPPNPVHMSDEHSNAIYEIADRAAWPFQARTGATPADWWRCSLVLLQVYGMRREDWLWLRRTAINYSKGLFHFRAKKTKKDHHLVLNDVVTAHLSRINSPSEFVFSPTKAHKQLYGQWHKLQTLAGVSRPDGLPYTFHDLRHTCAARYHEQFSGTAELLLGHALPRASKVTAESYIGQALLKPVHNAIRKIELPGAFYSLTPKSRPKAKPESQPALFD